MARDSSAIPFTSYQKFVIVTMAVTMFSVVLDFMIMSPLGDMLIKAFNMKPSQFGAAVSVYAFSAGFAGFLTAGFADRFDRKKLLLFFYIGFILGTFLCSVATSYQTLLAARIVTGLFGGVIGSICVAIVTDLFDIHHRGRVMGFVQMGFGASQVLGIPLGLYLANQWGWRGPFIMVGVLSCMTAVLIMLRLKPVVDHLSKQIDRSALSHLWHTFKKRHYRIGFFATALLSIGGFMMMPFGSAFAINNLKITQEQLPMLFMVAGCTSLIVLPLVGKLSDKIDKFTNFSIASVWMMIVVVFYTNLSASPLWFVMLFNVLMMIGILSRMVPAGALTTAIPDMQDRGAFMSINTSVQQIAGGIAAAAGGMIVLQKDKFSPLEHYNTLGYVMIVISFIGIFLMYRVSAIVKNKLHEKRV
jgi:predicted MFS family arabinose efflux permease